MKEVSRQLYYSIFDPMDILPQLNTIAKSYESEGYRVTRGLLGSVILHLEGGEVHFSPCDKGIEEVVFEAVV